MLQPPSCLDPVEPLARAVYETGWRPAFTPGPRRAEVREIVAAALERDGVDATPTPVRSA